MNLRDAGLITKGMVIEASLDFLDEEDRHRVRAEATKLTLEVPMKSKEYTGRRAPFGPRAALETLWAIGRLMNERFPEGDRQHK